MQKNPVTVFALIGCVMLAGCAGWSWSKADVTVTGTTTISKGQELTDLKRALDEAAISKRDYDKVREKILRRD
jgi:hypothetical protein